MNKVISVLKIGIKDTVFGLVSLKGCIVLLALFFFNYVETQPIVEFAAQTQLPIVPVTMPFIFYNLYFQLMFGLITIFLFSDVPFFVKENQYVIQRTGRRRWVFSKLVQIISTAVIFMVAEVIVSILVCGKNIEWSNQWGKIWRTLSLSETTDVVYVPRNVLIQFTPIEAMTRVIIMGVFVVSFIGMFMFFISLITSNLVAVVGTGIISVLPYVAANSAYYYSKIYYFCPMSWIGIIEYSETYIYGGPTGNDMFVVLLVIIAILLVLLVFIINKIDFVVRGKMG